MKLIVATPTDWDNHLTATEGHFLQSWAWGEFQETLGNKIWRLAIEDGGNPIAQLLVIKLSLGLNQSILYSPRGKLIDKNQSLAIAQPAALLLLAEIKKIAAAEKVICFRIDPPATIADITTDRFYASQGFLKNPKSIQPKHSLVLDLSSTPEQLLSRMRPKTRYNIHLAEKHNLVVAPSDQPEDLQIFLKLTQATSGRQGFTPHSDRYYQTQYSTLHSARIQQLWVARRNEQVIAAILVNTFGQTATYVHGTSDNTHRDLMAPYLLQFRAIESAKSQGVRYYDFWGIHPNPHHPWAGFTRFKRGFGGNEVEYIGTLELPTHPWLYRLYRLISKLR